MEFSSNFQLSKILKGHSAGISSIIFSQNEKNILSGDADGILKVWEVSTGNLLQTLEAPDEISGICLHKTDPNRVFCALKASSLYEFDLSSSNPPRKFENIPSVATSLDISPDGSTLAVGLGAGEIYLCDLDSWTVSGNVLKGNNSSSAAVCFSPDGKLLASGSHDGTTKIWELASGNILKKFEFNELGLWVKSVHFSPDGKQLASVAENYTIKIFDVSSEKVLQKFVGHAGKVLCVCFSSDGKTLVSSSNDFSVRTWNADTGSQLQKLEGHEDWVKTVAISKDGSTIVSGSEDKMIRIWSKN